MAKGFGLTWWGEHWLQALSDIDSDNRLPRGAAYARSGRVEDLEISGCDISAKVIGTRYRPYDIHITVPRFSEKSIDRFMEEIMKHPSLISRLLNRQLDSRILELAEKVDVQVFPKSWKDLGMECNCPDWAVPCKHLAATIYMLSREIDNNPFVIFQLHGLNLVEELNKRGVEVNAANTITISDTSEALFRLAEKEERSSRHGGHIQAQVAKQLNFTKLKNIGEAIVNVLPDFPPFYEKGNFKDAYGKDVARVQKAAEKLLSTMNLSSYPDTANPVEIDRDTDWNLTINDYMELAVNGHALSDKESKALVRSLLDIPAEVLIDYDVPVLAMRQALFTAMHLLKNGAVKPLLTRRPDETFAVDWVPVMMGPGVTELMGEMEERFPQDSLKVIITDHDKAPEEITNPGMVAVTFFLNVLVALLSRDTHTESDIIRDLFINRISYGFYDVGEKEKPGNILSWLNRLDVSWERYVPVFCVQETEGDSLEFTVEVLLEDKEQSYLKPSPLRRLLEEKGHFDNDNFDLLQELSSLSALVPGLTKYIDEGAKTPIRMGADTFTRFLMDSIPAVRFLGAKVVLPRALAELIRPRPSMTISRSGRSSSVSYLNLDSLLSFKWQVAVGDDMMTLAEFNQLLDRANGLIRFKSSYIYVDEADLQRLHKAFREQKPLTSVQLLQTALSEEYEGTKVTLTPEVKKLIDELTTPSPEPLPAGLTANVRPYQERGYSWMWRNMRIGFGSIIADDMGLGKTLQVIALLLRLKQEGGLERKKALVVAPTGLLTNWQAEIEKFAPSLSSFIYHGAQRAIWGFNHDVLITSYGVLRSDETALKNMKWRVMVIDEAQTIKNSNTAQSKAVRNIPADTHIAMSGTPVENRLSEYWTIMDFVNKGYLGTPKHFQKEYVRPIQNDGDPKVIEKFRKITSPLMMRRMKTDKSIISDLPEKIEENRYAPLTPQQTALYQEVVECAMREIEGISSTDNQSMFKRQGLVLQMILALKQICNHPAQYLKHGDHSANLSGKVELLLDLLGSIVESGEKVLVFTQFREMGEILQEIITNRFGRKPMFYHGGTPVKERQSMVEAFQTDSRKQVFLLSLKAAGTGLNLTAASHVIHFDLWWNPAVEAQATDRAYRIGQGKNVMVHRFITRNTFEEKIDEMIQRKKELAELTVAAGENWIGRLSNKELHEIFDR